MLLIKQLKALGQFIAPARTIAEALAGGITVFKPNLPVYSAARAPLKDILGYHKKVCYF